MRFASSICATSDVSQALDELLAPIDARVTPGMVDFALVFATAHFDDDLQSVVDRLSASFPTAVLLGCTVEGTIGNDRELERVPSISLLVASMPDVRIHPFHLRQKDLAAISTALDWERIVAVSPESHPTFLALADPFRISMQGFIDQINDVYPGSALIGGVASAASAPRQNRLIIGGEIHREGVVGVALSGDVQVDTVVSQGCRPIGKPFVITKADRNVIMELGGNSPLQQLHDVLVNLPADDEQLARESLFLGRVIDEYKERFVRGDFLIHNIIGVDRKSGVIAIAGHARVGATVQFHVRDAASADEDLRALLAVHADDDVCGAALFGCNGRGTQMWPKPGHDAGVVREVLGDIPVGGCFCGGEFGPVANRNFIHGFTASIALFRQPSTDRRRSGPDPVEFSNED